jgi:integrase
MNSLQNGQALHNIPIAALTDDWISEHSRWFDKSWYFENPTAGQTKDRSTIKWDFDLPDGSTFTDPQWGKLLEACKRFFFSLREEPLKGKPWKPGSVACLSESIKYLVRWMVQNNYASFNELNSDACDEFLDDLVKDKVTGDFDDGGINAVSLSYYIGILIKLYHQGPVLKLMGISPMPSVPFHGRKSLDVAKELAHTVYGSIPPVPDSVFIPTANATMKWLDERAEEILNLQEACLSLHSKEVTGQSQKARLIPNFKRTLSKNKIKAFRSLVLQVTDDPWHTPVGAKESDRANNHMESINFKPRLQIRKLITELRDACVITLQAFVGMRISEVCGLRAYPLDRKTNLPACVEICPSRSGHYDVFFVKGRLFKTTENEQEATWVAGMRPRGTEYLPPPIKALIVLERLFRPWRDLAGRKDLILLFKPKSGLPKTPKSVGSINAFALNRGQQDWIKKHVELPADFADWRVTTHQWRKSFALYTIRTDNRMLAAVSQHFKHVSLLMTEQAYVGNDIELLGIRKDMVVQETTRILWEVTTGKTCAGGKMAEKIHMRTDEIGTKLADKTADQQRKEIEGLVYSTDIRVWSCDWGWCFFRPETSRCHIQQPGRRLLAFKPDDATRNPNICCECSNLITTQEHIPFWIERHTKWKNQLEEHKKNGFEEFVLIARDRVNQCESVLHMMGVNLKE